MTITHYQHYQQWKNISLVLISSLLLTLTSIQVVYYYKVDNLSKKLALNNSSQDAQAPGAGPLLGALKDIDEQDLYKTLKALLETMPPYVKIEKLEWNNKKELTITCRAQNEAGVACMLEACGKNEILKKKKKKNGRKRIK